MPSPKTLLKTFPWKIARRLAQKLGAIAALVLLGGLLSATLVRLAPGFDADERELDPGLNAESVRALRQSRAGEHNILSFTPDTSVAPSAVISVLLTPLASPCRVFCASV